MTAPVSPVAIVGRMADQTATLADHLAGSAAARTALVEGGRRVAEEVKAIRECVADATQQHKLNIDSINALSAEMETLNGMLEGFLTSLGVTPLASVVLPFSTAANSTGPGEPATASGEGETGEASPDAGKPGKGRPRAKKATS